MNPIHFCFWGGHMGDVIQTQCPVGLQQMSPSWPRHQQTRCQHVRTSTSICVLTHTHTHTQHMHEAYVLFHTSMLTQEDELEPRTGLSICPKPSHTAWRPASQHLQITPNTSTLCCAVHLCTSCSGLQVWLSFIHVCIFQSGSLWACTHEYKKPQVWCQLESTSLSLLKLKHVTVFCPITPINIWMAVAPQPPNPVPVVLNIQVSV